MKLFYRCYADWPVWTEKAGYEMHLQKSRDEVRDAILQATGILLNYVNPVCAKGGTSTDGKHARRFFSPELDGVIGNLMSKKHNEKHKDNIDLLHKPLRHHIHIS